MSPILEALLATLFTFSITALGAAAVFLFKRRIPVRTERAFLGFAAGVMFAASVWSLLLPSIDMATEQVLMLPWLPTAGGVALGTLFLLSLDRLLPHLRKLANGKVCYPGTEHRTSMLVLAVTLHNIPEGLAIGLAFGLAAQSGQPAAFSGAVALALGIGVQNFPEGAAISLPLRKSGASRLRAFIAGALSGAVEPIAGVLGAYLSLLVAPMMPWFLAFAAGAMIYVVVEELIPEANLGDCSHISTLSVMLGFLMMMILDVALG